MLPRYAQFMIWCTSLVFLTVASGPGAVEGVETLVQRMERAVLAGDAAAYVACVDPTDDAFLEEQKNWAADLTAHTPARFDVRISELEADGASATGELEMEWSMRGEGATRSVAYPARFVRSGDAWLYAGEAWERVERDGILAMHLGGAATAEKVVEVFPAVRAHVHEGFEVTIERTQQVKLYPTMEHLQASIYLSYEDPLSGWNEPGESVKIVPMDAPRANSLRALLAHEYGHVATFAMGNQATKMPWWAAEGAAELAAERFARDARFKRDSVKSLAESGRLAPWDAIADFRATEQRYMPLVYMQGHAMLGFISERFGRQKRNAWLRELTNGVSLDEATERALGRSFETLDREFVESLVAPATPASAP